MNAQIKRTLDSILSPLLRIRLIYKILLANSALVAIGAIGGTVATVWHVQAFPNDLHYELIPIFGAVGLALSFLINYGVLRVALRPLDRLQATVNRVRGGDLSARLIAGRQDDDRFALLTETFNQMLTAQTEANQELRTFSQRILEAQEDERQRVARELHDQSAQTLTMMLVRLHLLEKSGEPEQVRLHSKELRKLTAQALDDVRRIALELRPKILEDLGLSEALAWQVDEINASGALSASIKTIGIDRRLPKDIELAFYRVGQEALTNIARHAGAKIARVTLQRNAADVTLVIEDDGRGFDPARSQTEHRGLGLSGMRERLALVGGTLKIDSRPRQGTRVTATAPVGG